MGYIDQVYHKFVGEKSMIPFLFYDSDGNALDVSACTFVLMAFSGTSSLFTVQDTSFVKTDAASGRVEALGDYSAAGDWTLLLITTFSTGEVDKSISRLVIEDIVLPQIYMLAYLPVLEIEAAAS